MPEIVLTEEQAQILAGAKTAVVIRNPNGTAVGTIDPKEAAIIAEAKRRLATPGPRYSGAQVLAMLDALQAERNRIGSFDAAYAMEFVERLEKSDPEKYGPKESAIAHTA
jgi:hypothetical protein